MAGKPLLVKTDRRLLLGLAGLLVLLVATSGCVQFSTARTRLEDDLRKRTTAEIDSLAVRVDKASVENPDGSIDRERFERSLRVSIVDPSLLEPIESPLFSISGIVNADVRDDIGVVDFFVAVGSVSQDGPWTSRGVWFGCGAFEVSFPSRTTSVVDTECPDSVLALLGGRGGKVSVADLFNASEAQP